MNEGERGGVVVTLVFLRPVNHCGYIKAMRESGGGGGE